jgi:hypothetical protein
MDYMTTGQPADMLKYYKDMILQSIEQGAIIREKAAELGLSVSEDEINKELERRKFTKDEASNDLINTSLLAVKISARECEPKIPATVEQVEVQAMFLESKTMAEDRRNKLVVGENFSKMAGMLSVDTVTQSKSGYLGWIARGYEDHGLGSLYGSSIKDSIFTLPAGQISNPVYDDVTEKPYGYWVLQLLEKNTDKGNHMRGILCASKEDADNVRLMLVQGSNWDEMAKQYSVHESKERGGDLGWIIPGVDKTILGRMSESLSGDVISESIRDDSLKTKGGYWIIQVMNKSASRPLDDTVKKAVNNKCMADLIEGWIKDAKIERLIDEKQKDWAVEKVVKSRGKSR